MSGTLFRNQICRCVPTATAPPTAASRARDGTGTAASAGLGERRGELGISPHPAAELTRPGYAPGAG